MHAFTGSVPGVPGSLTCCSLHSVQA